jgi:hypothetical protein
MDKRIMSRHILKMADRLERICRTNERARTDKYFALALIWIEDLKGDIHPEVTKFLAELTKKRKERNVSATETVTRAWRKVVSVHPEWSDTENDLTKFGQQVDVKEQLKLF